MQEKEVKIHKCGFCWSIEEMDKENEQTLTPKILSNFPTKDMVAVSCPRCHMVGPAYAQEQTPEAIVGWNTINFAVIQYIQTIINRHKLANEVYGNDKENVEAVKKLISSIDDENVLMHSGHFLLGHDSKIGNVILSIAETLPIISIRPKIAISLGVGLLYAVLSLDNSMSNHVKSAINKLINSNQTLKKD